jgi:hypothetical protein
MRNAHSLACSRTMSGGSSLSSIAIRLSLDWPAERRGPPARTTHPRSISPHASRSPSRRCFVLAAASQQRPDAPQPMRPVSHGEEFVEEGEQLFDPGWLVLVRRPPREKLFDQPRPRQVRSIANPWSHLNSGHRSRSPGGTPDVLITAIIVAPRVPCQSRDPARRPVTGRPREHKPGARFESLHHKSPHAGRHTSPIRSPPAGRRAPLPGHVGHIDRPMLSIGHDLVHLARHVVDGACNDQFRSQ